MAESDGPETTGSDDPLYEPIVRAATELVLARGHEGLDPAAVAWRAGASTSDLQRVFSSMDELLVAVLEWRDVKDIEAVRDHMIELARTGPVPTAHRLLRELVIRNAAQPNLLILYSCLNAKSIDPKHPAHQYFERRYQESCDIIADIVSDCADNPTETASHILAAMDGLQLQWLRDTSAFDLVAAWDRFASRLLPELHED